MLLNIQALQVLNMAQHLQTLSAVFSLSTSEVPMDQWRGSFAALSKDDLLHQHNTIDGERIKRYPLIQYRKSGAHYSVFGINQGAELLLKMRSEGLFENYSLNKKKKKLEIVQWDEKFRQTVDTISTGHWPIYTVNEIIPLHPDNARKYHQFQSFHDRVDFVEHQLNNYIVSFAKGVNWTIPKERPVNSKLLDIIKIERIQLFGASLLMFDIEFASTALLPEGIGIGRKVAFGHGVVSATGKYRSLIV